ncbi:50S ribosomal protein L9 [endosymbiont GvMRE of Glomus versiforme]|uniref:50S ribosomal protein L9 n=1 Tax=endosymbiont GvMRE of Glomus versiforme TaxID=2039283 RepID=UPI000EBE73DF|nr:50S ribosomal protein L9 [endosymbiont GvMRE of Glomus versiforme]RHZ35232.1 50S ribosomal protein L9 [endosymbiont GvMRE of Glomus versiforme]
MKKLEKVIFLSTIGGEKGDIKVKNLRRGFIVNYLLPKKKVLLANKKNLFWLENQKKKKDNLVFEEKAQELYKKINNFSLTFILKKNNKGRVFGSVSSREILSELKKSDFSFKKNQLLEFCPLNKLGENMVKVKLSNKLVANLKIIIN